MNDNRVKKIIAVPPAEPRTMKVASERLKSGALNLVAKAGLLHPMERLLAGATMRRMRRNLRKRLQT